MIPDAATLARRRHTVTIIVRSFIALFGAWIAWGAVVGLGQILYPLFGSGIDFFFQAVLNFLFQHVPALLLIVALIVFEQRLVRWIVPTPRPDTSFPKCGYSLKDLKSPICPECGTSLRG